MVYSYKYIKIIKQNLVKTAITSDLSILVLESKLVPPVANQSYQFQPSALSGNGTRKDTTSITLPGGVFKREGKIKYCFIDS